MKVKIKNIELEVENDMTFWNNISDWEKYSFEIIDKFINGNTFVDIGAWNGVLSLYASFKAKEVHSFEPDKIAFKNLENNIKLNSINNIKINNAGASNINGVANLYVRSFGDSVSSLIERKEEKYHSHIIEKILTINISEYLSKINNIGLIKIDIEGGEEILIPSMNDYIRENKPAMYVSFHPNWFSEKEKMIHYFADLFSENYKIYTILHKEISKQDFINGLNGKEHSYYFVCK